MSRSSAPSGENARAKVCAKGQLDSPETAALGEALWKAMSSGEAPSLALMSKVTPSTMRRQLRASDRTRVLADVVITHLARMPEATARDVFDQWLFAAKRRVLPELLDARQIDLFPRLKGLRGVPR